MILSLALGEASQLLNFLFHQAQHHKPRKKRRKIIMSSFLRLQLCAAQFYSLLASTSPRPMPSSPSPPTSTSSACSSSSTSPGQTVQLASAQVQLPFHCIVRFFGVKKRILVLAPQSTNFKLDQIVPQRSARERF